MKLSHRLVYNSFKSICMKNVRGISYTKINSNSSPSESILSKKYSLPEAMEAISLLRQTSRFLSSDKIPDTTLKRILKLTSTTPTSFNLQPYRLLVIDTKEGKEALASCMLGANQDTVLNSPVSVVVVNFKSNYSL